MKRRQFVNKRHSASKFRRQSGKTKAPNLRMSPRGGIRL